jgi:hypothetical protein
LKVEAEKPAEEEEESVQAVDRSISGGYSPVARNIGDKLRGIWTKFIEATDEPLDDDHSNNSKQ